MFYLFAKIIVNNYFSIFIADIGHEFLFKKNVDGLG